MLLTDRRRTGLCSAEPRDWLAMTEDCALQPISVALGFFQGSYSRGLECPSGAGPWSREEGGAAGQSRKLQPAGSYLVDDFEGRPKKQHKNIPIL